MAHPAIISVRRCLRTVVVSPVELVVAWCEIVRRQMTSLAVIRHSILSMALHALGHLGKMSGLACE